MWGSTVLRKRFFFCFKENHINISNVNKSCFLQLKNVLNELAMERQWMIFIVLRLLGNVSYSTKKFIANFRLSNIYLKEINILANSNVFIDILTHRCLECLTLKNRMGKCTFSLQEKPNTWALFK